MGYLKQMEGFLNRHLHPLPVIQCKIQIVETGADGDNIYMCEWFPFDKNNYTDKDMPGEGYLGTARVIEGDYPGIGFHAWEQNDYEFLLYKIV